MTDRFKIAKKFANNINSDYIRQIILFGSVARGEDKEGSDIDILIVTAHKNKVSDKISNEVVKVILEDEEFISAHIISENRFNKTQHFSFISNVLEEGVVIGWNSRIL